MEEKPDSFLHAVKNSKLSAEVEPFVPRQYHDVTNNVYPNSFVTQPYQDVPPYMANCFPFVQEDYMGSCDMSSWNAYLPNMPLSTGQYSSLQMPVSHNTFQHPSNQFIPQQYSFRQRNQNWRSKQQKPNQNTAGEKKPWLLANTVKHDSDSYSSKTSTSDGEYSGFVSTSGSSVEMLQTNKKNRNTSRGGNRGSFSNRGIKKPQVEDVPKKAQITPKVVNNESQGQPQSQPKPNQGSNRNNPQNSRTHSCTLGDFFQGAKTSKKIKSFAAQPQKSVETRNSSKTALPLRPSKQPSKENANFKFENLNIDWPAAGENSLFSQSNSSVPVVKQRSFADIIKSVPLPDVPNKSATPVNNLGGFSSVFPDRVNLDRNCFPKENTTSGSIVSNNFENSSDHNLVSNSTCSKVVGSSRPLNSIKRQQDDFLCDFVNLTISDQTCPNLETKINDNYSVSCATDSVPTFSFLKQIENGNSAQKLSTKQNSKLPRSERTRGNADANTGAKFKHADKENNAMRTFEFNLPDSFSDGIADKTSNSLELSHISSKSNTLDRNNIQKKSDPIANRNRPTPWNKAKKSELNNKYNNNKDPEIYSDKLKDHMKRWNKDTVETESSSSSTKCAKTKESPVQKICKTEAFSYKDVYGEKSNSDVEKTLSATRISNRRNSVELIPKKDSGAKAREAFSQETKGASEDGKSKKQKNKKKKKKGEPMSYLQGKMVFLSQKLYMLLTKQNENSASEINELSVLENYEEYPELGNQSQKPLLPSRKEAKISEDEATVLKDIGEEDAAHEWSDIESDDGCDKLLNLKYSASNPLHNYLCQTAKDFVGLQNVNKPVQTSLTAPLSYSAALQQKKMSGQLKHGDQSTGSLPSSNQRQTEDQANQKVNKKSNNSSLMVKQKTEPQQKAQHLDNDQQSLKKKRKRKDPIELNIIEMLSTFEKRKTSKKTLTETSLKTRGSRNGKVYPVVANILDSTAPLRRRGKERETPAKKRLSALKKVILSERAEKKRQLLLQEKRKNNIASGGASDTDGYITEESVCEDSCPQGSGIQSMSQLIKQESEDVVYAKSVIHSRRFREYCNHMLKSEIDEIVTTLLQDLIRFHTRLYHKDPLKARIRRRIVLGLREVTKHLKLRKLKCLIIAPNLDKIRSKGGLDDAVSTIIRLADEQNIPCIFSLGRKALGRVCLKKVPVSCVGIFNYEGSQDNYFKLLELVTEARREYSEALSLARLKYTSERQANAVLEGLNNPSNKPKSPQLGTVCN